MSENVKVIVRCRPMNKKEIDSKADRIVEFSDCIISVINPASRNAPTKSFTFDSVYDDLSTTETIYNDMCYALVESTLEGYNGTIFAYGQTGCGKTHTMQGEPGCAGVGEESKGIIQRCFDHIFEKISMATSVRYLALVSFLEIYNENIRDLLCPEPLNGVRNHPLKDIPGIGVTVPTLTTQAVLNSTDCYNWLSIGNKNRVTAATLMNENSSRSHTIFTISLEQIQESSTPMLGGIRRGKLNLVDLAGSERQCKTGAFGDRLKEATKINLSLSALGNVISALVDGKTRHVPYRDSKLTRLLQDSLGGNTKTLMVACVSPADSNYDETLSTLRYACRAKNISNVPRINEDPKDAQLRQYQEEILNLKRMLDASQHQQQPALEDKHVEDNDKEKAMWLEEAKVRIRQQMMAEMKETALNTAHQDTPKNIPTGEDIQLHARKRINLIKHALIGGERVDDLQLRERHRMRKLEAKRHLSAIAHALNRVESEDRDLLQEHYASIQQEINMKNERIKKCGQKIKMLEREVADLNSEFQMDREDYLDEIRHLSCNLKFYQLLMNKAQPILRKNGRNCVLKAACYKSKFEKSVEFSRDPEEIMKNSVWNDDLKTWKLPNNIEHNLKLPPANLRVEFQRSNFSESNVGKTSLDASSEIGDTEQGLSAIINQETPEMYKVNILKNYFRPNRKNNDQCVQRSKSSQAYIYNKYFKLRRNAPLPINDDLEVQPYVQKDCGKLDHQTEEDP